MAEKTAAGKAAARYSKPAPSQSSAESSMDATKSEGTGGTAGGGNEVGDRHARERAEMHDRHSVERSDMFKRHESEFKSISDRHLQEMMDTAHSDMKGGTNG